MIIRLKSNNGEVIPLDKDSLDKELITTYKQFTKSYSEGCKTPSNDMSQVSNSEHMVDSDVEFVSSKRKNTLRQYHPFLGSGSDLFEMFSTNPQRYNSSYTASKDNSSCS